MLDIFWVKIIGAVVAAVLTMAAGFLPRIDAVRVNPMVLELLNMFGGGVFLCVAMLDLLPNVVEGFEAFTAEHNFNLGFILILVGYASILFLEKILFRHEHAFHHHGHGHPREPEENEEVEEDAIVNVDGTLSKVRHDHDKEKKEKKVKKGYHHDDGGDGRGHGHGHGDGDDGEKKKKEKHKQKEAEAAALTYGSIDLQSRDEVVVGLDSALSPAQDEKTKLIHKRKSAMVETPVALDGELAGQLNSTRPDKRRNQELEDAEHSALVTVLLLLAALTIHSFFEGVVVGTLTAGADSLTLILALVSHKPLESLSLGTIMIRGDLTLKWYAIIITVLSCITPAGIAVGMVLDSIQKDVPLLIPCFYAIAVGSFLYIATTEIVSEEISHIKTLRVGLAKFASFLLGIVFIALITTLIPEVH